MAALEPWNLDRPSDTVQEPTVWVLADDRAGNVAQALGVAEALAWPFDKKDIAYTGWARLPNWLRGASLRGLTPASQDALMGPWPDVVIAAGRRTAPVARWIKRQNNGKTFLCQVMWPGGSGAADFDLIAVPTHDDLSPVHRNVVRITGAPHRVTEAKLAIEATRWAPRLEALKKPLVALVVGGSTKNRTFTVEMARELAEQASAVAKDMGGTLVVTTSRRTGDEPARALLEALPQAGHVFRWTPEATPSDNPYFGYLALADAIIVTGDSVSMVSEACASPAPVYVYAPPALIAPKHQRLLKHLYGLGMAEALENRSSYAWEHPPLNAASEIAALIRSAMVITLTQRKGAAALLPGPSSKDNGNRRLSDNGRT